MAAKRKGGREVLSFTAKKSAAGEASRRPSNAHGR